jgi:hypothetical protein
MKRITILAATSALLAFPAIGSTAAVAATSHSPAAQVHAKHGADDPAGHRHHHRADDKSGVRKHGADDPAGHRRHAHHRANHA